MNYYKLKEAIEKAVAIGDVDYLLSLMTVENAVTVTAFQERQKAESDFLDSIRKAVPMLSKLSDEEMTVLFDSESTAQDKQTYLASKGIKLPEPEKNNTEWLLSQK